MRSESGTKNGKGEKAEGNSRNNKLLHASASDSNKSKGSVVAKQPATSGSRNKPVTDFKHDERGSKDTSKNQSKFSKVLYSMPITNQM